MSWVAILKLVLQIAAIIAKRAERTDVERAVLNEIAILNRRRVDAAARARGDVFGGRMPDDPGDPYRRD